MLLDEQEFSTEVGPFFSAISITGDREDKADFLPSYFESGLKVRGDVKSALVPSHGHGKCPMKTAMLCIEGNWVY